MMKISIITANLNNVAQIGRTIGSVISQTHRPLEMIIVDGGSTDGSLEIINEAIRLNGDIISLITDTTPGVYHAINRGIAAATGDVVGLLHGNDRFSRPDILSSVAEAMDNGDVDFIYGDIHFVDPDSGKTRRLYSSAGFSPEHLLDCFAPPHPSLYIRREKALTVGPYREDYVTAADFEMFVRLFNDKSLRSRRLDLDMVAMTLGGMSTSLRNRLFTNPIEKRRALKEFKLKPSLTGNMRRIICNILTILKK